MDLVYFHSSLPHFILDNNSSQVFLFGCQYLPSLRVNLDLGKIVYAYQIEHDPDVSDTIVRSSTIPEELGRIEYLFTDKTGTVTKNGITSITTGANLRYGTQEVAHRNCELQ